MIKVLLLETSTCGLHIGCALLVLPHHNSVCLEIVYLAASLRYWHLYTMFLSYSPGNSATRYPRLPVSRPRLGLPGESSAVPRGYGQVAYVHREPDYWYQGCATEGFPRTTDYPNDQKSCKYGLQIHKDLGSRFSA